MIPHAPSRCKGMAEGEWRVIAGRAGYSDRKRNMRYQSSSQRIYQGAAVLFLLGYMAIPAAAETIRKPLPRKDSFWGVHLDLHPNDKDTELGAAITEEMLRTFLDRVRPDYVQYDCKGHAGYTGYPSKVGWPSPGIVRDSLAYWRKATREKGIGLYIHYSGVWDTKALEEHPEWARVDAEGKKDKDITSVFGPYVDRLLIPQLKEAISSYDLDGAWVDGECWAAKWDYSAAALDSWKRATGFQEAPRRKEDPHWQEWKQFHRQAFERYLAHWVDALHSWRPEAQLTSNWMYTTLAPKPVVARLDFLSGDYSASNSVDRARLDARYLASTGMPWDLMAWGFDKSRISGWSLKPTVHLQQEAAVVLMQGGGFQVYHTPTRSGYLAPGIIDQLSEVGRFCRERQKWSHKSTSIPQVAVLLSTDSLMELSDALHSPGREYDELQGAVHALLELHYSVDVLAEHQIRDRLAEYPVVVVPNAQRLEDGFRQKLLGYVRQGGSLFLAGEKSARLFPDVLGVALQGSPSKQNAELAAPGGVVNAEGEWQKVELQGARALAWRYPTRDQRKTGDVALSVKPEGEGKIAAAFGPLSAHFYYGHHPALRSLWGQVMQELFPDPAVRVDGPPTVDISLRRAPTGPLTLHLLNRANMPIPERYHFTDFVPPTGPVTVRLRVGRKPGHVRWEPQGDTVRWSWKDGTLSAVVPRLEVHGILVVE